MSSGGGGGGSKDAAAAAAAPAGLPEGAKPFDLPEGASSIEIGREFSAFKVVPKADGESNDANFPHHLHAAVELFCHAGMPDNAKRCAEAVRGYLSILKQGPDGKNTNGMGQAAICWSCGHVGLPKNPENTSKGEDAKCGGCGSDEQTNLIKVTQPDGTIVPWIEFKAPPPASAPAE